MIKKQITAQAAVELINCGDTVTIAGFVGVGVPDEILLALENRFKKYCNPTDLTLLFAAAPGDGKERGLNRLAHAGMLRRTIGGHYGLAPKLGRLATSGKIQAYNFPQGVISHMYRDIAAGKRGTLTRVGIDTFVDPRIEGGKINKQTTEDLVEVVTISGEEMLFYKTHKVDVAIIRGTSADADGNISMEREALRIDNLSQAMAAKNSGGIVIAQVERIVPAKTLSPRMVEVPSAMIDAIVLAKPENHVQTYGTVYSPYLDGQDRAPSKKIKMSPLDARKVIARRTALELPFGGGVVNLGIGVRVYQMNAKTDLTELSGQVVLPTLNIGFNYTLLTKHQIQFGINTTTNAAIQDFRSQMSDLFRYNFMIYYQYNFNDKFSGMIGYEGIIYPNQDIYVIENPRYLISTGIQYNFCK